LSGCGLIPKNVEFFQDKVKAVPAATVADKEIQKQAADLAARKAEETLRAAIRESASDSVVKPAEDTSLLTRSVTTSLGPPLHPWNAEADLIAARLEASVARLDRKLDKFAEKQEENVGKKIEGSGLFSIPWIVYVCGFALVVFIGLLGVKVLLAVLSAANPGAGVAVAVGTRAASLGAHTVAKGFSQLIHGGKDFKAEVAKEFPDMAERIIELFHKTHKQAQDGDIQALIKELAK
jgi:hypothetical protein